MITEAQLYSLLDSARDIEYLRERIERLRSSLESASPALGRIGSHGSAEHDKMAANIARLADMQGELAEKVYAREQLMQGFESALDYIQFAEREVVRLRYGLGYGWKRVARQTSYHIRSCYRVNRKFCSEIRKLSLNVTY